MDVCLYVFYVPSLSIVEQPKEKESVKERHGREKRELCVCVCMLFCFSSGYFSFEKSLSSVAPATATEQIDICLRIPTLYIQHTCIDRTYVNTTIYV